MNEKLKWLLVIFVSMTLGGATVVGINSLDEDAGPSVIERVVTGSDSNGALVRSVEDVSSLYDAVRPSVVRITTQGSRAATGGLGSGVILDKEGRILTNNHVIAGASQIDVTLADGTAATARVIGTDPGNDLAIIQVDLPADKLKPATLADSDKVRVGETVIAVGNPFGIEGSLTQGIVSGIGRTLASGGGRPLRQLIQSDAAINPGNSGGGLFNARGELIGITTAIENPSGDRVFVGIGYAVPVNTATRFLPDMVAGRQIEHPRLGISLQDLTPALAERLGLSVNQGVMVVSVESNSAAARAGLRGGSGASASTAGDVIIAIDSTETPTFEKLASYIDSKRVGDRVSVRIVRGGSQMTLDVTLEAWRATT
jgi:2-alkenal reductase